MSTAEDLFNDGILGRVECIAAMRGEEVCIVVDPAPFDAFSGDVDSESCMGGAEQATDEDEIESISEGVRETSDSSVDDSDEEEESVPESDMSKTLEGVTYTELQWAYQAVAAQLQCRYGAKCGDRVIVCGKGNIAAEMTALLACMQVRAPFVPIDAAWFVGTRVQDIVKDAQPVAAIVVADNDSDSIVTSLAAAGLYRCVYLRPSGEMVQSFDTADSSLQETSDTNSANMGDNNQNPLYILYTSGSTGRPKGVIGTHRGLVNRIAWQMKHFPFAPGEVVCRRTPLVFVDAMAEIFSALVCMVPLWSPPADRLRAEGIGGIAAEAHQAGVSRITLLPSQLYQACMLYPQIGSVWQSLKVVFVSGEECTAGVVKIVQQCLPAVTLINLYGSTEVAGDVSYYVAYDGSSPHTSTSEGSTCHGEMHRVPIGYPMDGNYLFVVEGVRQSGDPTLSEDRLRVLSDGEVGELMVVGEHLAMGYHNNAVSLTSRFVPNPLLDPQCALGNGNIPAEARCYPMAFFTGDLAYRDANSGMYFWCGRVDRQVKIRGVRVELEDVERQVSVALQTDQGIVVLALDLQKNTENDTQSAKLLVLFLENSVLRGVTESQGARSVEQIKAELTQKLPPSLVPGLVLAVDAFPRNTTGKIDRTELQRNVEAMFLSSEQGRDPLNLPNITISELSEREIATEILNTYLRVLNVSSLVNADPLETNFFALGGDSVRLIEALWSLRQRTQLSITPADVHLSVKDLARKIYAELQEAESAQENPTKRHKSVDTNLVPSFSAASTLSAASTDNKVDGVCYPLPVAGTAPSLPKSGLRFWRGRGNSGTYPERAYEDSECVLDHCAPTSEGRLIVKWSVPLVKCVDASPLVIVAPSVAQIESDASNAASESLIPQHLVIIGSHGGDVVAVEGVSGAVVWTLQLGEHIEASAVSDTTASRIFVGTFSGQDVDGFQSKRPVGNSSTAESELGCFWCIDALTGDILWHVCTTGEIKSAALVVGESVFVGAYDGHLYQFEVSSGALLGKYSCGGSIYAAPVLSADGKCIFAATTAGTLTQFDYLGGCAPLTVLGTMTSAPMFATPASIPTGELLTAATDGSVTHWAQQTERNRVLSPMWKETFSTKPIFSSPCLLSPSPNNSHPVKLLGLVGCHDGCLRLFDSENGALQWEKSHDKVAIFSTPGLLSKDLCVTATVAGDVQVTWIPTGRVLTSLKLPGEVFSSAVCLNDCVYIGCRDDRLYCLQLVLNSL